MNNISNLNELITKNFNKFLTNYFNNMYFRNDVILYML